MKGFVSFLCVYLAQARCRQRHLTNTSPPPVIDVGRRILCAFYELLCVDTLLCHCSCTYSSLFLGGTNYIVSKGETDRVVAGDGHEARYYF